GRGDHHNDALPPLRDPHRSAPSERWADRGGWATGRGGVLPCRSPSLTPCHHPGTCSRISRSYFIITSCKTPTLREHWWRSPPASWAISWYCAARALPAIASPV